MQTQNIYTRLFICVDAATSLLLKQEMVEAEFARAEIGRIFTELVPFKVLRHYDVYDRLAARR